MIIYLIYFLIFAAAFIVLAWASSFLVRSLTRISRFFGLSEYAVAFLFMSIATSIPEFFVGLSSAIGNIPQFSLGNVLGANFLNISLVIGLVIVLGRGLHVESKISRRNFWIISGIAFLPLFLASDGVISRGDGFVLLLTFIFYILKLQKEKEHFSRGIDGVKSIVLSARRSNNQQRRSIFDIFKQLSHFFGGVFFLLISSFVIVWAGRNLADRLSLSFLSFGILFVSLGTALPELAFGIRAKMLKHGSMTIGNSMGSIAFNSSLIVGVVSIIRPISISFTWSLLPVALFLFLALLFFNIFVYSKSFISRREGAVLLALYLLFLLFEYFGQLV